jgi:hypothetical protein
MAKDVGYIIVLDPRSMTAQLTSHWADQTWDGEGDLKAPAFFVSRVIESDPHGLTVTQIASSKRKLTEASTFFVPHHAIALILTVDDVTKGEESFGFAMRN